VRSGSWLMDWVRGLWGAGRSAARGESYERELEEEIRFHLEMEAQRLEREEGMTPPEARRRAARLFGRVERSKEAVRGGRWTWPVEELGRDARLTLRRLRNEPGFTAVAVLTLALGIGGTAAVFGVVDSVLLRPLPYPDADRIVTLWERTEAGSMAAISEPNFEDWRARSGSFEVMALHGNPEFGGPVTVLGAERAVRARPTPVWAGFFEIFDVAPVLGRPFLDGDRTEGAPGVVLVSYSFWRSHLGGDPSVVDRPLHLLGESYEVVGVLPDGFHFPADTDLWLPAERWGSNPYRTAHNWAGIGRLREGVSLAAANTELERIGAALREEHGDDSDARGAVATRLQDALVGDLRAPLLLLLAASGLVLLIACSNLGGTLLGRGVARRREVAIRSALGAGRPRLVRQLVTESLVLSALGAVAGLALAAILGRALLAFAPASIDPSALGFDARVLAFAAAVTLATTLLVGLVPALRASDTDAGDALRSGTRGTTAGRSRLWGTLVGAEVALALLLLVGSGLLIRSFAGILAIDPGFDANRVLTAEVALPGTTYESDELKAGYYQRLLDQLADLPGVRVAGLVQHIPFGGVDWNGSFEIEGRGQSGDFGLYGHYRVASAGYFEAMGIPVLEGRSFTSADRHGTLPVAMVNRSLAERAWPGESAVGKRIRDLANEPSAYRDEWLTVVGVVGDVRHGGLLSGQPPEVYVNVLQRPDRAGAAVVTLRADLPPAALAPAVRERVRALDPDVPVELIPMSARIMDTLASRRFTLLVLGVFAAIAVTLAAVGVYGIVTYTVARRAREIGIRLALGATPRRVRSMVQRHVMPIVAAGLVAGAAAALLATRLMAGLLHGVTPTDPAVFAAVAATLAGVAWLASYIPARRTARIDPMETMRGE
jgi:putative ABC transport system permease protein